MSWVYMITRDSDLPWKSVTGFKGIGSFQCRVDSHSLFNSTRCIYIVRKDGTRIDFSYLKCLKALVENKFPDSAKAFIERYLSQRK